MTTMERLKGMMRGMYSHSQAKKPATTETLRLAVTTLACLSFAEFLDLQRFDRTADVAERAQSRQCVECSPLLLAWSLQSPV